MTVRLGRLVQLQSLLMMNSRSLVLVEYLCALQHRNFGGGTLILRYLLPNAPPQLLRFRSHFFVAGACNVVLKETRNRLSQTLRPGKGF